MTGHERDDQNRAAGALKYHGTNSTVTTIANP
jgi:hypothetical protein